MGVLITERLPYAFTDPGMVSLMRGMARELGPAGRAALALLEQPPARRPTAVLAVTGVLALAVLEAAARLGLVVPHQLSVVGFDDIEEAGRARPPLTTVAQDLEGKGRLAARAALDLVADRPVRSPRLNARLVVRESTSAPAR